MKKLLTFIVSLAVIAGGYFIYKDYRTPTKPPTKQALTFGGAGDKTFTPTLLPLSDSSWDIGTSTNAYRTGYFDQICLTADSCQTAWPSGGPGGSSAYEIATGSIAVPQVAYFTKTGGRTTLGSIATGTVSVPTGLTATANRYVLGGNLAIGLDTGYVIPTQAALDAKEDDLTFSWPLTRSVNTISFGGLSTTTDSGMSQGFLYVGSGGLFKTVSTSTALATKQDVLVSGTNIKTINGSSILGSGDLTVTGGNGLASSTPWTFGSLVVAKDNGSVTTISTSTINTSQLTNDAGFLSSVDISANTNLSATWPVILTGDALSFGGLSTTTNLTTGHIPFVSGARTFSSRATTSASCSGSVSCSSFDVLGSSPITITGTDNTSSTTLLGDTNSWTGINRFSFASSTQFSVSGNTWLTGLSAGTLNISGNGLVYSGATTTFGSGYATTTQNALTFSTTTQTTNGQTLGVRIVPTAGALTFTPTISGTLDNAGLTNSSITINGSSVSLGGSLTVSSTTLLANSNSWSGVNRFGYASSTYHSFDTASSTQWLGGGLTSCSNGVTSKLLYNSTTGQFSCGTDQTGGGTAVQLPSYIVAASGGTHTTIQSALDSCGTDGGGNIYLTDGYYYQGTTGLVFKGGDCHIIGRGMGTTTIEFAGATTGFKTNSAAGLYSRNSIEGVTIVADGNTSSVAIDASDMGRSKYEDIAVDNVGTCVKLDDTQNITFYNNFKNISCTTITAFGINASSTKPVNSNLFENFFVGGGANTTALEMNNSNGNTFIQFRSEPSSVTGTIGIHIFDSTLATNDGVFQNTFQDSYIEANGTGIKMDASVGDGGGIRRNMFNGGMVESNTTDFNLGTSIAATNNFFNLTDTTFGNPVMSLQSLAIASTSPFATLAINPTAGLYSNQFVIGSSTATSLIVNNNGYVGVGLTSPGAKFTVSGSDATSDGLGAGIKLSNTASGGADWYFRSGATGNNTGAGAFSIADNSGYRMSILPNGNVGIATTTPSYQLTIASTTGSQLSLSAGTGIAQWAFRNAGGSLFLSTTTVAGTATSSLAALEIDGTTGGLKVNSTATSTVRGKFEIGSSTTALANSFLSITGNENSYIQAHLQNTNTGNNASSVFTAAENRGTDTTYYAEFGINNSGYAQSAFSAQNGGDAFLNVNDGGLVIGTASSTNRLADLRFTTGGTASSSIRWMIDNTGYGMMGTTTNTKFSTLTVASSTAPQISLSSGVAGVPQWMFRNAGGNLYFATSTAAGTSTSTPFFSLLNTGNLLIGTTTPWLNSAMNVVGTTTIKGQIGSLLASTTAASTQNIDWSNGNTQAIMLTSATTQIVINSTSSNPIAGLGYTLYICQDPTGGRAVNWATPGQLRWWNGTTTITTTANKCTWIGMKYTNLNGNNIYSVIASSTNVDIR